MGLFDFVKNIGRKLFSNESQANQKIEEHIRENNPGIKDLKVAFKNGTAHLSGEAQTLEALQKTVLMAGNIEGVESVNIDGMKVPTHLSSPAEIETYDETQYYIIASGDTLSKIAQHFYGSAKRYPEIFDANREVIKDPDLIFPGQKIRIPRASSQTPKGASKMDHIAQHQKSPQHGANA